MGVASRSDGPTCCEPCHACFFSRGPPCFDPRGARAANCARSDRASHNPSRRTSDRPGSPFSRVRARTACSRAAATAARFAGCRCGRATGAARGPEPPPITASSEKFFTGKEVNALPFARPGDALEIVPGLVVTQHSGEGKANQYFLRGFNLDHGTDLALYLDGMPLNMRTHGHAQGYADSNFLIPELLSYVLARKGPYDAQDGDFSSAGSIYMQYKDRIDKGFFQVTGGSFGYARALAVAPYQDFAGGSAYGAVEAQYYNGPWERGDNMRRLNSVLRWSRGTQEDGASVTFMGYANKWYGTDQIPESRGQRRVAVAMGHDGPNRRRRDLALLALVAAGVRLRAITPRASKPMSSIRPWISTALTPISWRIRIWATRSVSSTIARSSALTRSMRSDGPT